MKQFIRDYFTFDRRQRNGIFILLAIILLLILYLSFADFLFPGEKIDFSKFENEIADFEAQLKSAEDSSLFDRKNYFTGNNENYSNIHDTTESERFLFNPNNLPEEQWKRLGLSGKQIQTIKNYESKGGKFRAKEDVKKMYGITPKLYVSLDPYIQIPTESIGYEKKNGIKIPLSSSPSPLGEGFRVRSGEAIELNSADTSVLIQLKGIGSVFAKRIVNLRNVLGGFVRKEQLLDVYGFDKEKLDLIYGQIILDTSAVKKININTASVEDLDKHPYIDKKVAVAIFTRRVKIGDYADLQEIKQLGVVDAGLYTKIAPYLKIE